MIASIGSRPSTSATCSAAGAQPCPSKTPARPAAISRAWHSRPRRTPSPGSAQLPEPWRPPRSRRPSGLALAMITAGAPAPGRTSRRISSGRRPRPALLVKLSVIVSPSPSRAGEQTQRSQEDDRRDDPVRPGVAPTTLREASPQAVRRDVGLVVQCGTRGQKIQRPTRTAQPAGRSTSRPPCKRCRSRTPGPGRGRSSARRTTGRAGPG